MPKAFRFENKYETQLFDTWSKTIEKMGSFRVRQTYYPHLMDVLHQRTLLLEQTKRNFLTMYKNASYYFNHEHILKKYFLTEMTGDLFEQNLDIKHAMKMLYSDEEQEHFDNHFRDLVRLENKYFNDVFSYFEKAYLQKQAYDTMEAADGLLLLRKSTNQKKATTQYKNKLKNEFVRRSARIGAMESNNSLISMKRGSYFTSDL